MRFGGVYVFHVFFIFFLWPVLLAGSLRIEQHSHLLLSFFLLLLFFSCYAFFIFADEDMTVGE